MSDLAGIDPKKVDTTVKGLSSLLGDVFVLYVKVLNFHWNIKGKRFAPLHQFLEDQYKFLAVTADDIAERIRIYDRKAPGSMREFLELATLTESTKEHLTTDEMLTIIAADYGHLIAHMRREHAHTAENDFGVQNLYEDLITSLEKTRWMIKSHLV